MPLPDDPDQSRWFAENVQPHEAVLRAWLRGRFTDESDLDDVVQESFMRILGARERGEVRAPKAFLFATARNIAVDRLRHRQVVRIDSLAEIDTLAVADGASSVPEAVARSEELELLTRAIQALPERCRQVITLRKIYGLSQREIAAQLGISENTVESQGTIGLRKCADFFARHQRTDFPRK